MKPLVLSATRLQYGRDLLESAVLTFPDRTRLERFYNWVETEVAIDSAVVRRAFDQKWREHRAEKTLEFWDHAMENYSLSRVLRLVVGATTFSVSALVITGAVAAIVLLARSCQ